MREQCNLLHHCRTHALQATGNLKFTKLPLHAVFGHWEWAGSTLLRKAIASLSWQQSSLTPWVLGPPTCTLATGHSSLTSAADCNQHSLLLLLLNLRLIPFKLEPKALLYYQAFARLFVTFWWRSSQLQKSHFVPDLVTCFNLPARLL